MFCAFTVPWPVFLTFLFVDVIATDHTIRPLNLLTAMLPFYLALIGLILRAISSLDLTMRPNDLRYRTGFRTRTIPRSDIATCGVEEVSAAYGTSKAVRPYLALTSQRRVPLRIFGGLKPDLNVRRPPAWFVQMGELTKAIDVWVSAPVDTDR